MRRVAEREQCERHPASGATPAARANQRRGETAHEHEIEGDPDHEVAQLDDLGLRDPSTSAGATMAVTPTRSQS